MHDNHLQLSHRRRRRRCTGRGIAMLLVLISVMSATIVTSAYISSRDNSAAIGGNIADAATAKWSAQAGAQLTVRTLQSQVNWRSEASDGVLLLETPIGDADVTVTIEDVATQTNPTSETEHIDALIVARAGQMEQVSAVSAFVHATPLETVDPSLREFAVFANGSIRMSNGSMIARWFTSPLADRTYDLAVGSRYNGSGGVRLSSSYVAGGALHMGPSSGSSSISLSGGALPVRLKKVNSEIPLPAPPDPGDTPDGTFGPAMFLDGGTASVSDSSLRIDSSEVRNGGRLTFSGTTHRTILNDFRIDRSSMVVIDGHATFIIFGDVVIDESALVVTPGSTLRMFVGGNVNVHRGYIGDAGSVAEFDFSGTATYMDPERIMLMSIDSQETGTTWRIEQTSTVKARVYATAATVDLRSTAAIYGCVVASSVLMDRGSAVFYDHMLDRRRGYTRQGYLLYNDDGTIHDAFLNLSTFDDSDLQTAADDADATVFAFFPDEPPFEPQSGGGDGDDSGGLITKTLRWLLGSSEPEEVAIDTDDAFLPIDYNVTAIGVDVTEGP